ncbi:hypothetical protein J1N35_023072, partial [Gossypium stocksii]
LERDADEEQIKTSYRRLAKFYHPDVYDGKGTLEEGETAEARFIKIQAAYELLIDGERRRQYDMDNRVNPMKLCNERPNILTPNLLGNKFLCGYCFDRYVLKMWVFGLGISGCIKEAQDAAFVLVAGGLGERLGYNGIKIGTDIEDFKCSWLVVKALEICNEEQKKVLYENYGKPDPANVAKVKALFFRSYFSGSMKLPPPFYFGTTFYVY